MSVLTTCPERVVCLQGSGLKHVKQTPCPRQPEAVHIPAGSSCSSPAAAQRCGTGCRRGGVSLLGLEVRKDCSKDSRILHQFMDRLRG